MTYYSTMDKVREHYTVESTGNPRCPYRLHGPRGAQYSLWRKMNQPTMLFAMNHGTPITLPKVGAQYIKAV